MKVFKTVVTQIEQDGHRVVAEELIYEGPQITIHSENGDYLNVMERMADGKVIFWKVNVEPVPPELELLQGGKAEDE